MPNRETWDWKSLEPDVPITMTMIFKRTTRDDGEREDGTPWHRYPVKINGEEFTMFARDERMHQILQALDINAKGKEFTVTKKREYNKETGKDSFYYEFTTNGQAADTREESEEPPQPDKSPPKQELSTEEEDFENIALPVWETAYAWITDGLPEEPTDEQKVQLKMAIVKECSTMVNTQVMKR